MLSLTRGRHAPILRLGLTLKGNPGDLLVATRHAVGHTRRQPGGTRFERTMNIINTTLGALRSAIARANAAEISSDERYLSESADLGDLEHRMRELDHLRRPMFVPALNIYPAGSGR
jgi:hypothetical protein